MKRYFQIGMIMVMVSLLSTTTVFGMEDLTRLFMGNYHDTLVIGEVTSIDDGEVVIEVEDYIVSAHSVEAGAEGRQVRPEVARVSGALDWLADLEVGDYVIASLDQSEDAFVVAWGIFKVDSLDYETLHVEAETTLLSALYTDFVNRGGVYSYEVRGDGRVIRLQGDAEIVIYDPDPPGIQPRDDDEIIGEDGEIGIVPIAGELDLEADEVEEESSGFNIWFIVIGVVLLAVIVGAIFVKKAKKS